MADPVAELPQEPSPKPVDSIEVDEEVKEEDTGEADGEGGDGGEGAGRLSGELLKEMKAVCDTLSDHYITLKGDDGYYYPAALFRKIPNKRHFPDYDTIIEEPRAISTLRSKTLTKKYTGFAEYVRDFALIVHNAQVFNRPNSGPVKDVLVLKSVFERELDRLVERGLISKEDRAFPDLGEIPDPTPEPDPATDDEDDGEDDGEGDEDDEDDEPDESDDEEKGKRSRRRSGRAGAGRKRDRSDEGQKGGDGDGRKRRGRPPRVDTPMEARIKAVLKGIRKFRNDAGHLKVLAFERLPDKAPNPGYYLEIKEPIAIDLIKRRAKRKKYQSLEHFMRDLELMFSNAMQYNEDESDLYNDARELREEAIKIAEAEKQKPDSEYLMEDGRLPLPNGILHNGELWKVGDWVHIQNPNDVTKPIVGQIYRTWQDTDGQQWVNACWYYRPEQTVHQYEKHFYPNEVVKTGQYRDHHVDEIVDRCFVMFVTRFSRGRPRGLDPSREVYICDARYNEERHRLNKIKTWASCLPDEVREKDYEMDMFDTPKKVKKVPSPIKHLLKPGAKQTDAPPPPRWGHENAPPIVGAVHCQPRDENQSPPPEPTPPPPPTPPSRPARRLTNTTHPQSVSRSSMEAQGLSAGHQSVAHITPGSAYQKHNSASPAPSVARPTSSYRQAHSSYSANSLAQNPSSQQNAYAQRTQSTPLAANPSNYNAPMSPASSAAAPSAARTGAAASSIHNISSAASTYQHQQQQQQQQPLTSIYPAGLPKRHPEAYVMSEAANSAIPLDIRSQFPRDDRGKVLWFTTPPVDGRNFARERAAAPPSSKDSVKSLAHTPEYLAAREERRIVMAERRKQGKRELDQELPPSKRRKSGTLLDDRASSPLGETQVQQLRYLTKHVLNSPKHHNKWYQNLYDVDANTAAEIERLDMARAAERMREAREKAAYFEERGKVDERRREREGQLDGRGFKDDWHGGY